MPVTRYCSAYINTKHSSALISQPLLNSLSSSHYLHELRYEEIENTVIHWLFYKIKDAAIYSNDCYILQNLSISDQVDQVTEFQWKEWQESKKESLIIRAKYIIIKIKTWSVFWLISYIYWTTSAMDNKMALCFGYFLNMTIRSMIAPRFLCCKTNSTPTNLIWSRSFT